MTVKRKIEKKKKRMKEVEKKKEKKKKREKKKETSRLQGHAGQRKGGGGALHPISSMAI